MIDQTQTEKKVLYSKQELIPWMLGIPTVVRNEIVEANCGTSAGYILKRGYTHDYTLAPTFKLKIALGLDKASNGVLDFRDFLENRDDIDFEYLHKVLGQRLRAERAARQASAKETAEA